jgi:hypothetical protein
VVTKDNAKVPHPVGPLCIVCRRREDDPLHGQAELGGLAHENVPTRFPQHAFDPGGHLCICGRVASDPIHENGRWIRRGGGELEQQRHDYDPGERRHTTRRTGDRQSEAWDKARERHDADEWNREHPEEK